MEADRLFTKRVPYSVEAEQAVIGSMMIDPSCIPSVIEQLTEEDFYIETADR